MRGDGADCAGAGTGEGARAVRCLVGGLAFGGGIARAAPHGVAWAWVCGSAEPLALELRCEVQVLRRRVMEVATAGVAVQRGRVRERGAWQG